MIDTMTFHWLFFLGHSGRVTRKLWVLETGMSIQLLIEDLISRLKLSCHLPLVNSIAHKNIISCTLHARNNHCKPCDLTGCKGFTSNWQIPSKQHNMATQVSFQAVGVLEWHHQVFELYLHGAMCHELLQCMIIKPASLESAFFRGSASIMDFFLKFFFFSFSLSWT